MAQHWCPMQGFVSAPRRAIAQSDTEAAALIDKLVAYQGGYPHKIPSQALQHHQAMPDSLVSVDLCQVDDTECFSEVASEAALAGSPGTASQAPGSNAWKSG